MPAGEVVVEGPWAPPLTHLPIYGPVLNEQSCVHVNRRIADRARGGTRVEARQSWLIVVQAYKINLTKENFQDV